LVSFYLTGTRLCQSGTLFGQLLSYRYPFASYRYPFADEPPLVSFYLTGTRLHLTGTRFDSGDFQDSASLPPQDLFTPEIRPTPHAPTLAARALASTLAAQALASTSIATVLASTLKAPLVPTAAASTLNTPALAPTVAAKAPAPAFTHHAPAPTFYAPGLAPTAAAAPTFTSQEPWGPRLGLAANYNDGGFVPSFYPNTLVAARETPSFRYTAGRGVPLTLQ
jgi:hypothetical protein